MASGKDPRIRKLAAKVGASVQMISHEGLLEMMEWGERYVNVLDNTGALETLDPLRIEPKRGRILTSTGKNAE